MIIVDLGCASGLWLELLDKYIPDNCTSRTVFVRFRNHRCIPNDYGILLFKGMIL